MHGKRLVQMELWYTEQLKISPGLPRIRKFFIWKFGGACSDCGWAGKNVYTGNWVIELDHIDGDRTNSAPTNFRLLCPNCHAMTPTYKSLNWVSDKDSFGVCRMPLEQEW